jgi:DNA-binding transcriptional LysR family regulator
MQTFCAVVEHVGFTGAQSILGMSQPAISAHIRDFEIRLGFQLCHRGRAGFRLTEKGEITYKKCREMLSTIEDFNADLGELKNKLTGVLRIGIMDSLITDKNFPLPSAIKRFYSRANETSLSMTMLSPENLEAELINGNIDLAIGFFANKHSSISYHRLYSENHLFYCGCDHPLFSIPKDEISMKLLRQHSIASRSYLQQKDLHYFRKSPTPATVSNIEALAILITSGQFMGFLPVHYAQNWVERGEMRVIDHLGLNWLSHIDLATRVSPTQKNIAKVFLEDIKASVKQSSL